MANETSKNTDETLFSTILRINSYICSQKLKINNLKRRK